MVRADAAKAWGAWEDAVLALEPGGQPNAFSDRPPADLLALARAWPDAELVAIGDSGHRGSDTMRERMLGALDRFARH